MLFVNYERFGPYEQGSRIGISVELILASAVGEPFGDMQGQYYSLVFGEAHLPSP